MTEPEGPTVDPNVLQYIKFSAKEMLQHLDERITLHNTTHEKSMERIDAKLDTLNTTISRGLIARPTWAQIGVMITIISIIIGLMVTIVPA